MKTKISLMTVIMLLGLFSFSAKETKTEEFKVYGNCGMCEKRIEKAAESVKGVTKADWDKETKMITVTYDESKTDIHKIHMAIAKVGHDSDMHKAANEDYDKLHGCCQYDRPKSKANMNGHKGHEKSEGTSSKTRSCCGKN